MNCSKLLVSLIGVTLLLSLVVGCSGVPTVVPEDVYQSDVTDPTLGSAKNITVEQTPDGMKITGSEISVLAIMGPNSFRIETEPEGAQWEYTAGDVAFSEEALGFYIKAISLGEDSSVPARIPMEERAFFDREWWGFFPGTPGSQNISVRINPGLHTDVAGLQFRQEAVLNVWEDGTVEVDREGVVASDTDGNEWVSKKVKFGGKVAIIMIKEK